MAQKTHASIFKFYHTAFSLNIIINLYSKFIEKGKP